ncbi:hypothetical protein Q3G72_034048 [Acer saccharum]|nr:hypothetical protein Q3G72_034048 [Acer saccharum]
MRLVTVNEATRERQWKRSVLGVNPTRKERTRLGDGILRRVRGRGGRRSGMQRRVEKFLVLSSFDLAPKPIEKPNDDNALDI